jgi:nicotinamidase-related amidase
MIAATTALLVIDAQTGLLERAHRRDETIAAINDLISRARAANAPVVYVQHDGGDEDRAWVGTDAWQIHPAILPRRDELLIRKPASDSFYGTRLRSELERIGIGRLVVAGLRTEMCIDTTCRVATSSGFDVELAADAHTTRDGDHLSAAQIVAHHNETLDDFGNDEHVVVVRPAAEIAF